MSSVSFFPNPHSPIQVLFDKLPGICAFFFMVMLYNEPRKIKTFLILVFFLLLGGKISKEQHINKKVRYFKAM